MVVTGLVDPVGQTRSPADKSETYTASQDKMTSRRDNHVAAVMDVLCSSEVKLRDANCESCRSQAIYDNSIMKQLDHTAAIASFKDHRMLTIPAGNDLTHGLEA